MPDDEKPYVPMKQARQQKPFVVTQGSSSKKGKKKAKFSPRADGEAGFDVEKEWFINYLSKSNILSRMPLLTYGLS